MRIKKYFTNRIVVLCLLMIIQKSHAQSDTSFLAEDSMIWVGQSLFENKKYNESIQLLKQYLDEHEFVYNNSTAKANLLLAQSYQKQKNFKAANIYLLSSIKIKDSILRANNHDLVKGLKQKQKDQILEKQILDKKINAFQFERNIKKRNLLILIISIVLLSIIVFIIIIKRVYTKKINIQKQQLVQLEHQEGINLMEVRIHGEANERIQIAKYLQTGIGKNISEVKDQFKLLKQKHLELRSVQEIEDVIKIISLAQDQLESSVSVLRPKIFNIEKEILLLIKKVHPDLRVHLEVSDAFSEAIEYSGNSGNMVFRIIQELFQNSIKHSQAKDIWISLLLTEDNKYLLKVVDNGIGMNPIVSKNGFGLSNIIHVVKTKNGTFNIIDENGMHVIITLPIPKNAQL